MKKNCGQTKLAGLLATIALFGLPLSSAVMGQPTSGFLNAIEPGRSLVGIPIQYPALLSGTISQLISETSLQISEPGNQGMPLQIPEIPMVLEIVAPPGHPCLGHRLELDEVATRQATPGIICIDLASSLNTISPSADLVGADVNIRPHLTIGGLYERTLARRLPELRAEVLKFWFTTSFRSPFLIEPRGSPQGGLIWVVPSTGRMRYAQLDETILSPGSCVQVESRLSSSLRTSLTGLARTNPCRFPVSSGPNLLSYPYPVPMRLGIDWGNPGSGLRGSVEPQSCDQISFWSEETKRFLTYGYFQAPGTQQGVWREIRNPTGSQPSWAGAPAKTVVFEAGEGWILRKANPDPKHTFYPPLP